MAKIPRLLERYCALHMRLRKILAVVQIELAFTILQYCRCSKKAFAQTDKAFEIKQHDH